MGSLSMATWSFLKFDMRHEGYKCSDKGHFLNPTYDIEENKRQRLATLLFLKCDMQHSGPPFKGPPE